jgi:hypothetical protein
MMITAHTTDEPTYPAYFNVTERDDDSVHIVVRGHPKVQDGVRICGRECKPGSYGCNNYCNFDRSRPMADAPEPFTHTYCGETASIRVTKAVWEAMKAEILASH